MTRLKTLFTRSITAAALALSTAACASIPADMPTVGAPSWPTTEKPGMTNETAQTTTDADIGAELVTAPMLLRFDGNCRQKGTQIALEKHVVGPRYVLAGEDISQSFTYTLCGRGAETVDGTLISRIYHDGQPISVRERDYRLTAGRWHVRFEATVPEGAPGGRYDMELEFQDGAAERFADKQPFRIVD
ncbi:MAG: hypothetical protein AAGJ32_07160 [Pseudomonadota bacterium]